MPRDLNWNDGHAERPVSLNVRNFLNVSAHEHVFNSAWYSRTTFYRTLPGLDLLGCDKANARKIFVQNTPDFELDWWTFVFDWLLSIGLGTCKREGPNRPDTPPRRQTKNKRKNMEGNMNLNTPWCSSPPLLSSCASRDIVVLIWN